MYVHNATQARCALGLDIGQTLRFTHGTSTNSLPRAAQIEKREKNRREKRKRGEERLSDICIYICIHIFNLLSAKAMSLMVILPYSSEPKFRTAAAFSPASEHMSQIKSRKELSNRCQWWGGKKGTLFPRLSSGQSLFLSHTCLDAHTLPRYVNINIYIYVTTLLTARCASSSICSTTALRSARAFHSCSNALRCTGLMPPRLVLKPSRSFLLVLTYLRHRARQLALRRRACRRRCTLSC